MEEISNLAVIYSVSPGGRQGLRSRYLASSGTQLGMRDVLFPILAARTIKVAPALLAI